MADENSRRDEEEGKAGRAGREKTSEREAERQEA